MSLRLKKLPWVPPGQFASALSSTARIRLAAVATRAWTRSASVSENYDAIGRWRTHDGTLPIDPGDGPDVLRQHLLKDQDRFARCLASKLATYALGRKASLPSVRGNETLSQLVEQIIREGAHE